MGKIVVIPEEIKIPYLSSYRTDYVGSFNSTDWMRFVKIILDEGKEAYYYQPPGEQMRFYIVTDDDSWCDVTSLVANSKTKFHRYIGVSK